MLRRAYTKGGKEDTFLRNGNFTIFDKMKNTAMKRNLFLLLMLCLNITAFAQQFKVLAFYTGANDLAHISFVNEANAWFPKKAKELGFSYEATTDWNRLNEAELKQYQVILFLDTRPEKPEQRAAFEKYMQNGGGWIGFHFSAFALTPSTYPDDWKWYHDTFLGSGQYKSNTWRPTSAVLKNEGQKSPFTKGLPKTFSSQPNEWYRWENDLTKNPDVQIVLSIDPSSFPLGTGPKEYEIWHEGYYPVVWTNKKYRMLYINMGHNDMDYEGGTNATLSHSFGNESQDKLITNALLFLGRKK